MANQEALMVASLKNNLTNPYSNMNKEGREILGKAAFRGSVEYLHQGSWFPKKASDKRFNEASVYRIKADFYI